MLRADPDGAEIVGGRLRRRHERRRRHEIADVDPVRIARLGEKLLGLRGSYGSGGVCSANSITRGTMTRGRRTEAETGDLVDRLTIQRVVGREPHALVVPRRLRIPLLGELDPVDRRVLGRDELQPRVALHVLRVLAVERVGDVGFAVLQHRHPRRPLGHALHDEPLDDGHAAPVARVRLEHDLDAGACGSRSCRARRRSVAFGSRRRRPGCTYFLGTTMPAAVAVVP